MRKCSRLNVLAARFTGRKWRCNWWQHPATFNREGELLKRGRVILHILSRSDEQFARKMERLAMRFAHLASRTSGVRRQKTGNYVQHGASFEPLTDTTRVSPP